MKQNTLPAPPSAEQPSVAAYEHIEGFARLFILKLLQQVLEEVVENLLGRLRS